MKAFDLMVAKVLALNSLYLWHSILSPVEYEIWHRDVYGWLLRNALVRFDDRLSKGVYLLLHRLSGPGAVSDNLPLFVELLPKLSAAQSSEMLDFLWRNRNYGEGFPLHSILVVHMKPVAEKLVARLERQDATNPHIRRAREILEKLQK